MAVAVILSLLYNYTSNVGIQDFIIYQERNGLCQLSRIFNFQQTTQNCTLARKYIYAFATMFI